MAYQVYKPRTQAISNRILAEMRRKRAVTGFGDLTGGQVEGITRAVLTTEGAKAGASERFGVGVKERAEARQDAIEAAEAQGRVNIMQTGVNLALIPGQLKASTEAAAATDRLTAAITGTTPAVPTVDAVAAVTSPSAIPAITAGADTFISAGTGEVVSTVTGKVVGAAAAPAAETVVAGAVPAAEAATMTVSTALGVFGFGMVGGQVGRMFHDSDLAEGIGGVTAGAIAGSYIFPGVGTLIGGIIGGASSLIDDTVICTELYRQGYITEKEKQASREWRQRNVSEHEYLGYRVWADKVVWLMKHSYIITQLVRPLGVAWVRTIANRWNPGNLVGPIERAVGNALLAMGLPFCRFIYRRKVRHA